METPYEYYDNKLGIKVSYLTSDRCHNKTLSLIKYNALYKRTKSSTCCEKELRRASLNMDALILFSSLSRDFKDAITTKFGNPKKEIKKSWFAQQYVADRDAFNFYVAYRYGKNNETKLDIKLLEQYTFNASVLNTVITMKANRKAYIKALGATSIDIWDSLSKDVNAFREVAHNLPTNKDSLRRKANAYTKGSYQALISGRLQNSNAKKVTSKEQMALLDELLAKHTNLDNELICTLYNVVAERINWKPITATTVANRKIKSGLVTYAGRNSVKSLKHKVLMQVKRSKPSSPMLYWTLDGWDVELLYQKTSINDKGHKVTTYHNRLTMVLVLDPYNNYPIGYAIGDRETPALIKKALQNAMQHARELFGEFYMPYQLQSDNYSIKKLRPLYEAITPHFTPAEVGNSKAKVIEPYFNYINNKYCKLLENWSGYGVASGSKNQPNTEYLQLIKKQFPDRNENIKQIEALVTAERSKKQKDYLANWKNTQPKHKKLMPAENYLLTFGSLTGHTNKLKGEGLIITIEGQKHAFDSFDINFRHHAHLDWEVHYDTNDLSQALAVSSDGSQRFMLESKYIQPMALADRQEGDTDELKRIRDFNKDAITYVIEERASNANILEPFLNQEALQGTLAKHLLTDSRGQHKNIKSKERLQAQNTAKKLNKKTIQVAAKKNAKTFADEQREYYESKVNANDYINA